MRTWPGYAQPPSTQSGPGPSTRPVSTNDFTPMTTSPEPLKVLGVQQVPIRGTCRQHIGAVVAGKGELLAVDQIILGFQ